MKIFLSGIICLVTFSASATACFAEELVAESDSTELSAEPTSDATDGYVEESTADSAEPVDSSVDSTEPATPPVTVDQTTVAADASLPTTAPQKTPIVKADSMLGRFAYLLNGDPSIATAPSYGFGFSPAGVHWGARTNDYFQITSFKVTPTEAAADVAGLTATIGGIF